MIATWAARHLLHLVLFFPGLVAGAGKPRYSGGLKAQCLPVCARLQSEFKDSLGGLLRPDFKTGGKERCWGCSSVGQCFLAPGSVSSTRAITNIPRQALLMLCLLLYRQCLGHLLSLGWCSTNPFYNNPGHSQKNAVCSWGLPPQLPCL